jgi:hypothetical protein
VEEARAAAQQASGALAAEVDSARADALEAALGEARASLAALQRQHASGQDSMAALQARTPSPLFRSLARAWHASASP